MIKLQFTNLFSKIGANNLFLKGEIALKVVLNQTIDILSKYFHSILFFHKSDFSILISFKETIALSIRFYHNEMNTF
jgi:hypothetical protein